MAIYLLMTILDASYLFERLELACDAWLARDVRGTVAEVVRRDRNGPPRHDEHGEEIRESRWVPGRSVSQSNGAEPLC